MIFTLDPDERARYKTWNARHLNEKHGGSEVQLHKDNPTNLYIPDGAA